MYCHIVTAAKFVFFLEKLLLVFSHNCHQNVVDLTDNKIRFQYLYYLCHYKLGKANVSSSYLCSTYIHVCRMYFSVRIYNINTLTL